MSSWWGPGIDRWDSITEKLTSWPNLPALGYLGFPSEDVSLAYGVDSCEGIFVLDLTVPNATFLTRTAVKGCGKIHQLIRGFAAVTLANGNHLLMILKGGQVEFLEVDPNNLPGSTPNPPGSTPNPKFSVEGVVNAANFEPVPRPDGPLARGAIISIFGTNLAKTAAGANVLPLPTNLGGTRVVATDNVGTEHECPLYYASPGQLNVLVPYEIPKGSWARLQVRVGDLSSGTFGLSVVDLAPALFRMPDGEPIVTHACDGALVTAANPLRAQPVDSCGPLFTLYATGLGPTVPSVKSGDPAPSDPLAWTVPETRVELSISGQTAEILYSGLTPDLASLYQVNAALPPGLSSGQHQGNLVVNDSTADTFSLHVE